jgi:DNA polymerase-3 subunit gamma/tau
MAHESLYRTHRPKTFEDVLGQEQVTGPLSEAVQSGKIGHAYLFAGSRGLGKTSVARIFARAINAGHFAEQDVYEIDAASNNSVEDIRALSDGVYTLPFGSTYKVYILDEAHMLSKSAWNAFLKTLEEPPSYAVFILATTELEKVPETVQSRCQIFTFKKPSRSALASLVAAVAKKEGYAMAPDAASLVARLADGSYRDALSVLQKVLVAGETGPAEKKELVTREAVERVTGAPRRELVLALVQALGAQDRAASLEAIAKAAESGADMKLFLELAVELLRSALLMRYAPELRSGIEEALGQDEAAALSEAASGKGITHDTLLAFLTANERMRYAPIPALPLELAVLELFP